MLKAKRIAAVIYFKKARYGKPESYLLSKRNNDWSFFEIRKHKSKSVFETASKALEKQLGIDSYGMYPRKLVLTIRNKTYLPFHAYTKKAQPTDKKESQRLVWMPAKRVKTALKGDDAKVFVLVDNAVSKVNPDQIKLFSHTAAYNKLFEEYKQEIIGVLGKETDVKHVGSSAIGLAGKKDLDIHVVISKDKLKSAAKSLIPLFGQPYTVLRDRIRFNEDKAGVNVEIHLLTPSSEDHFEAVIVTDYLKNHPDLAKEYVKGKKKHTKNKVVYNRYKAQFFQRILKRIKAKAVR